MKFRTKIWVLPLSAALVFIVGISLSFIVGARTSSAIEQLRETDNPYLMGINLIDRHAELFRNQLQAAAAEGDVDALEAVQAQAERVEQLILDAGEIEGKHEVASQLGDIFSRYQSAAIGATRAMLGIGQLGNQIVEMQAAQGEMTELMEAEIAYATQATLDRQAEADHGVATGLTINVLTGLVVLSVLGVASFLIINSVWRELGDEPNRLREAMKRVAEGDLSSELQVAPHDQVSLNASVQQMVSMLRDLVTRLHDASEAVHAGANEISSGTQELSARTEQQAAALQQTASSMEEMTATVQQNTETTEKANKLASEASRSAQSSGHDVKVNIELMREIAAYSSKMKDIIKVIDAIAFQTNILALNASVEAARAGAEGRGFAVVANEVRSLAGRSAESASQVRTLLEETHAKIIEGVEQADRSGQGISETETTISQLAILMKEVAAATHEQSSGILQINTAVTEMDSVTQQNASLVQASSRESLTLEEQARRLKALVGTFQINNKGAGGSSRLMENQDSSLSEVLLLGSNKLEKQQYATHG
ncbi:methyl-accepting chemotaxis protein [Litchfieldella xinjiangensis]|uniref:methyl-accepting chemotaxis protein n=1 Tax=Litchfieldella xinjiangensis TaxID=1166948 RepID=UPI000693595C|nr:methyl-accepting chemotaxis protein [Halomonas xinjiangensis]